MFYVNSRLYIFNNAKLKTRIIKHIHEFYRKDILINYSPKIKLIVITIN